MGQILTAGYVFFDGVKFIITTPTIVGPPGPTGAAGPPGPAGSPGIPGSGSGTIISSTSYSFTGSIPLKTLVANGSTPGSIVPADANAAATRPAIGLVQSLGSGIAFVQSEGEFSGFSGLAPGVQYYLSDSVAGTFTTTAPTTIGHIVQKVGYAKTSSIFVLEIDADFTLL